MKILYILSKVVGWIFGFILYITWPILMSGVVMLLKSFIEWDMENNFYWFVEFVTSGASLETRLIYIIIEFIVGIAILSSRQFTR